MKILRVIASVNPKGGGPIEGIKQQLLPLKELGVEVEVACCDDPAATWLQSPDLPTVHALGPASLGYGYSSRLLPWLRKNSRRFDRVIVHGLWQYHGLAVRTALAETRIPYYVFTHGMLDPWFKRRYPLKHIKKWLYWPWGEYRVLRDARAVIFTCEEERRLARESFWLYRVREAVTVYGTAGPSSEAADLKDKFLSEHPELNGKRVVLFLGRIHEKKGCDLLLEAFARFSGHDPKLHLVMAGPLGYLGQSLQRLSDRLGIAKRVTWLGMVQGDTKWGALASAEVFCLPSHQENFGIVVAEALASGTPVLISNKVNIWREIDAGLAGFVDEDDVEGTARNLTRWLELDEADRLAMSAHARTLFLTKFHIRSAARTLVDILSEPSDGDSAKTY